MNNYNGFVDQYYPDNRLNYSGVYTSVNVLKFLVYPTDRLDTLAYAPVIRPYQIDVNARVLGNLQDGLSQYAGRVSQNTINNLGRDIITLVETPTQMVDIPNGWGVNRLAFVCVFLVNDNGQESLEIVTGYTTHNGITNTGAIDPGMGFIVDKITKLDKNTGTITSSDTLRREFRSPISQQTLITARPEDVVQNANNNCLGLNDYGNGSVSTGLGEIVANKVTNNVPTVYLGNIINATYGVAALARGNNDGINFNSPGNRSGLYTDILSEPVLRNSNLVNFAVYRKIHLEANNELIDNLYYLAFTIPQLERITRQEVNIISLAKSDAMVMSDGMPLVNTSMETLYGQNLFNIINTLCVNNYIQAIRFYIKYNHIEGRYEVLLLDQNQFLSILSGQGLEWANGFILNGLELFRSGLESYINSYLTNGLVIYADVMYDMMGNTVFNLSVNGGPMTPVIIPTYVSSSMSPLYNKQTQFNALTDAVTSVIDYIVPTY